MGQIQSSLYITKGITDHNRLYWDSSYPSWASGYNNKPPKQPDFFSFLNELNHCNKKNTWSSLGGFPMIWDHSYFCKYQVHSTVRVCRVWFLGISDWSSWLFPLSKQFIFWWLFQFFQFPSRPMAHIWANDYQFAKSMLVHFGGITKPPRKGEFPSGSEWSLFQMHTWSESGHNAWRAPSLRVSSFLLRVAPFQYGSRKV